jgi:hypothetical protein
MNDMDVSVEHEKWMYLADDQLRDPVWCLNNPRGRASVNYLKSCRVAFLAPSMVKFRAMILIPNSWADTSCIYIGSRTGTPYFGSPETHSLLETVGSHGSGRGT